MFKFFGFKLLDAKDGVNLWAYGLVIMSIVQAYSGSAAFAETQLTKSKWMFDNLLGADNSSLQAATLSSWVSGLFTMCLIEIMAVVAVFVKHDKKLVDSEGVPFSKKSKTYSGLMVFVIGLIGWLGNNKGLALPAFNSEFAMWAKYAQSTVLNGLYSFFVAYGLHFFAKQLALRGFASELYKDFQEAKTQIFAEKLKTWTELAKKNIAKEAQKQGVYKEQANEIFTENLLKVA